MLLLLPTWTQWVATAPAALQGRPTYRSVHNSRTACMHQHTVHRTSNEVQAMPARVVLMHNSCISQACSTQGSPGTSQT